MTLRTSGAAKQLPTFLLIVISVEWSGWSKEPNEVDGEIPIGHTQFAWHVNSLLILERTRDEGRQIGISRLSAESPDPSIRESDHSTAGPTFISFDGVVGDGLDE